MNSKKKMEAGKLIKELRIKKGMTQEELADKTEVSVRTIQRIENGEDFAQLAAEYSQCSSGSSGGDLGEFSPGQMVPEFDRVVFNESIGEVHGPIGTQFGYHLVEIIERTP